MTSLQKALLQTLLMKKREKPRVLYQPEHLHSEPGQDFHGEVILTMPGLKMAHLVDEEGSCWCGPELAGVDDDGAYVWMHQISH